MRPFVCSPGPLLLLTLVVGGLTAAPARADEGPCAVSDEAAEQNQELAQGETTTFAEDTEPEVPIVVPLPVVADERSTVDPATAILQVESVVRRSRIGTEARVIRRGVQELLLLPDELSPTRLAVLGVTLYFTPEPFLERRMDLHRDGGRAKVTVGLAPDRIVVSGAFE